MEKKKKALLDLIFTLSSSAAASLLYASFSLFPDANHVVPRPGPGLEAFDGRHRVLARSRAQRVADEAR